MIKLQVFWSDNAVSTGKHLPTFRTIVTNGGNRLPIDRTRLGSSVTSQWKPLARSLIDSFLSSHFFVLFLFLSFFISSTSKIICPMQGWTIGAKQRLMEHGCDNGSGGGRGVQILCEVCPALDPGIWSPMEFHFITRICVNMEGTVTE